MCHHAHPKWWSFNWIKIKTKKKIQIKTNTHTHNTFLLYRTQLFIFIDLHRYKIMKKTEKNKIKLMKNITDMWQWISQVHFNHQIFCIFKLSIAQINNEHLQTNKHTHTYIQHRYCSNTKCIGANAQMFIVHKWWYGTFKREEYF